MTFFWIFYVSSNYERYRTKMKNHRELVEETESSHEVNRNIETETREIEILKHESKWIWIVSQYVITVSTRHWQRNNTDNIVQKYLVMFNW